MTAIARTPLQSLGENAVLKRILSCLSHAPAPPEGPGDDCAVVARNQEWDTLLKTDVVVENCEFAESKNSASDAGNYSSSRPEPTSAAGDGFMNIPDGVEDEGLPFN